jgi:signal transduction histidine kinase
LRASAMAHPEDTDFARIVSLACHDLRTPLATVHGFARTLSREDLTQPASRYVQMMIEASEQLAELLDDLSQAARIESGRFESVAAEADTVALARNAAEQLGEQAVAISGTGAQVVTDPEVAGRALFSLFRGALRHGGLDRLEVQVDGAELVLSPVRPEIAPILLGRELRDLGAALACRAIAALGGSVEVEGETLRVRLPSNVRNDAAGSG